VNRVLVIAWNEIQSLVRTKFFLLGLLVLPMLGVLLFGFTRYAQNAMAREPRRFAIVDETGVLYGPLARAADAHNHEKPAGGVPVTTFLPTQVNADGRSLESLEAALSTRVKAKEFSAFVVIPADILIADAKADVSVAYYAESATYQGLSNWLTGTIGDEAGKARLARAGIDAALATSLTKRPKLTTYGLIERHADGSTAPAQKVDAATRIAVPVFFTVLMFMSVMSNAQHLIHTVIEEKMSKISEVLLGSVTAFDLLLGKLLGIVAVSVGLAIVYLLAASYAALASARPDLIDLRLVGWFLIFLPCATLFYGAMFQALSSAASDLKDAQSLLQPAMFVLIIGYVSSLLVIQAPESPLVVAMSFFPPMTPFTMMLRLAIAPGPPLWQAVLAAALLLASTVVSVWAAGRVFRVGLLMQGKPPNLPELLKWIRQ